MIKRLAEGRMKRFLILTITVLLLNGCGKQGERGEITLNAEEEISPEGIMQGEQNMQGYSFDEFANVEITGIDVSALSEEEMSVLYQQARYCQAMTDADADTMREIISEEMIFTHMSGKQQTREEYLVDITKGRLNYFTIGIEDPVITVDGDKADIAFTSVLNANAYGARGTFRMSGTHHYEMRDGQWIAVNG